jgi:hypothetical protein
MSSRKSTDVFDFDSLGVDDFYGFLEVDAESNEKEVNGCFLTRNASVYMRHVFLRLQKPTERRPFSVTPIKIQTTPPPVR